MMKSFLGRLRSWSQAHPAWAAALLVLLVYAVYLPSTEYEIQYYDANGYWLYAEKYYETGEFTFLSYFNLVRGYLYSLLFAPLTQVAAHFGWVPLRMVQAVGAVVAALIFGWAGPALWQATTSGPAVPLWRRLLFAAFGFALWRDYFNFSLTDFPALLALVAALIALLRGQRLGSALLAGAALAAALNMRPVYQAALPVVVLLALLPPPGRARWWGLARAGALVVGGALVLLPQVHHNQQHVGVRSPWVLTNLPDQPSLFLQQLGWGLTMQKYETSVGGDYYRPTMIFEDKEGEALLKSTGEKVITQGEEYVRLCTDHPWQMLGVWQRHLFNGLDLQYPTPYILQVFVDTWPLAWLNYSIIWGGLLLLVALGMGSWKQRASSWPRPVLVLVALVIPCAAALPTAMECRFMLPLHMLLSGSVAFGASPVQWWRTASRRWRVGLSVSYVAFLVAAFSFSANAQKQLASTPRVITTPLNMFDALWDALRPAPAAEPW